MYTVHAEMDSVSGASRFRVIVLYGDGRIRPLPPQFRNEDSVEAYLKRWNPELSDKRVEYLQLLTEARRLNESAV
jgi:hypothetical protein